MMKKIVLIDGHSILNRAFYGVPLLTNASGVHTNAVYGFLNILFKILDEEKPQYLAVAFDVKEKTFRHLMFEEYKGTRKPMPTELHEQVPLIRELLSAMGILIMEKPGLEADDILGTMAKRAMKAGLEVSLISGDRDLLQIADEHIKIRIPKTKGGRTETENYFPKDVKEKYGVTPRQFIELKALMGDTSDNIPGVPKIGEKTATELIRAYGSVAGVYENLESVTKKAIKQSLSENREMAELSLKLATIEIDADIPYTWEAAEIGNLFTKEAFAICQNLELKSILSHFDVSVTREEKKMQIVRVKKLKDLSSVLQKALQADRVALSIIPMSDEVEEAVQLSFFEDQKEINKISFAICFDDGKTYFISAGDDLNDEQLSEALFELYLKAKKLICYHSKEIYKYLIPVETNKRMSSHEITKRIFDVLLGAFLLNPLKNDYEISDIASEYLGMHLPVFKQEFPKQTRIEAFQKNREAYATFVCDETYAIYCASSIIEDELQKQGMFQLYREIEQPLSYVLYEMEQSGVSVKPDELKNYGDALSVQIEELEKRVIEAAGISFNLNSPKQLGEILFDKLQLPGAKKTKSGYSTAADVLEGLAKDYPIVSDVLEYRGLAKLKSTYADGLGTQIADDGRIHTTFHQTITATGRISSTEPNLQNIPVRMEMGRKIRKVFVPKPGYIFMDADYSQIELRILAHVSEDEQLIEAYHEEEDIHRMTASKVFHVPFEEVTPLQRRNAKAVNFGIVYGISSFGLSQDLSISKKEAATYIEEYFNTYPGIKRFLDNAVNDAKEKGYSVTLFGRRRPIPEISSSNFMQRSFGERVAMNAPIQGTAADIMKIAMINVRDRLVRENLSSCILLQVHDELLLEVLKEEETAVAIVLREEMERAADLSVKLDVDLHTGENWYEAK